MYNKEKICKGCKNGIRTGCYNECGKSPNKHENVDERVKEEYCICNDCFDDGFKGIRCPHWKEYLKDLKVESGSEQLKKSDWRERFDKEHLFRLKGINPRYGEKTEDEELEDINAIKSFIQNELSQKDSERKEALKIQAESILGSLPKEVNSLEQVKELNKDLPSTLQEEAYLKSMGYLECLSECKEIIKGYIK